MKMTFDIPLEELLKILGVSVRELQSRVRTRRLSDARSMIAALLAPKYRMRQQDVADLFGTSQAAVSKMLVRHHQLMQFNTVYRNRYEQLYKLMSNRKNNL